VYAVAALAATWLALPVVTGAVMEALRGHPSTHRHAVGAPGAVDGDAGSVVAFTSGWVTGWSHWAVMVLAMMLPVLAAQVHTVATRSLWARRHRSSVAFVVGFLAVWFAVGGVLVAVVVSLGPGPGPWLALVLGVAAAWQVAPPRRRLLRRCSALRLGHPSGVDADLDCARAGLRSGLRCVGTCGPMMTAMVLSHSLVLMAALSLVMLSERSRGPDPLARAGRPREAWALLGLAVVAGAWGAAVR
jgi:predicted metal-binding membrane protein